MSPAAGVPATTPTAFVVGDLTKLTGTGGVTAALGGTCTGTTCVCDPTAGCKGWYRDLSVGEKVVNSPLTVAGITYFSTNKPKASSGTCDVNLGEARAYGVSFYGGTPNKTQPDGTIGTPLTGGGLPPSPVGGVVEIEPGKQVAFIIGGGDKGSPVEGGRITIPVASTRRKLYWNSATDK
jgi:type IV pilus assembly protein PilY1